MKNDTIVSCACMQHGMPQSLIVFAVSSRLETPKFGRSVKSRTILDMLLILFNFYVINVYMLKNP